MDVNPAAEPTAAKMGWRDFTPLLLLSVPLLYYPSFLYLGERWSKWSEGLSHGYLLIAVFTYLFYRALPFSLARPVSRSHFSAALLALVVTSVTWAILALVNINALAGLALLAIPFFWIAGVYGWRTAWQHRFLLALPLFTLSIWDYFTAPLVKLSATVVGYWVSLLDIPAVIEGSSIFIPYGHIIIADGCSGLRYFIIALAMAYTISYLNRYKEPGYSLALLIAAALALLTNWVRIFILIMVGYYTEMQSSLMHDHDFFGWVLFAVISLPALYFAPVRKYISDASPTTSAPNRWPVSIMCVALATGPLLYWASPSPSSSKAATNLVVQPTLPGWLKSAERDSGISEAQASYQRFGDVWYTRWSYQRIHKGEKLVPYISNLYNSRDWHMVEDSARAIVLSNTSVPTRLQQLSAKGSDADFVQLYWYQVGPWMTDNYFYAKLLQIPAILSGHSLFRLHILRTTCNQACSQAQDDLIKTATRLETVPG